MVNQAEEKIMPTYEITGPDGKTYEVEAPEGASEDQVLAFAQRNIQAEQGSLKNQFIESGKQALSGVLEGATGTVNLPMEAVRAAGEVVGISPENLPLSTSEIHQRLTESGIIAPEKTDIGSRSVRFTGGVVGGASSFPTKAINVTEQAMQEGLKLLKSPPGLRSAAEHGFKVPRASLKSSLGTNLIERAGGKVGIEATAKVSNQKLVNEMAAKSLGLSKNATITPQLLSNLREQAGGAYELAASIGPMKADKAYIDALRGIQKQFTGASKDFPELANQQVNKLVQALAKKEISSEGAISQIKTLRRAATANFKKGEPELASAQRAAAEALDDLIQRNIIPKLGKKAFDAYQEARVLIAKTHVIEKALNEGTNNVIGIQIAKQSKYVKLTDELKAISDFAKAYPHVAGEQVSAIPAGGLLESMAFAAAGKHMTGSAAAGIASAGIPLIGKPIARKLGSVVPQVGKQTLNPFLTSRVLAGTAMEIER